MAQVGFFNDVTGVHWEDVVLFETWSNQLDAQGLLPSEETWQYPPGAALLLLIPQVGGDFGESFVALMLLFDLAGLVLLAMLCRREGSDAGVWVWLLALPMLGTLSVLRFDLVPAVIAIGALLLIQRRPNWFGALVGLAAAIKAWPVVLLFGEWEWRRLVRACLGAAIAIALTMLVSAIAFSGDQLGFLSDQGGRGLQVEAVASLPWQVEQLATGVAPPSSIRFGAWEVVTHTADVTADLLKWATLFSLVAASAWWAARTRAVARGRRDLEDVAVSRDFVFTVVLLLVVTSRVLSPQYMIWLLALAAVVLATRASALRRPAWVVVGAAVLTTSAYGLATASTGQLDPEGSPFNLIVRNLALLFATADASLAMLKLLREPGA